MCCSKYSKDESRAVRCFFQVGGVTGKYGVRVPCKNYVIFTILHRLNHLSHDFLDVFWLYKNVIIYMYVCLCIYMYVCIYYVLYIYTYVPTVKRSGSIMMK